MTLSKKFYDILSIIFIISIIGLFYFGFNSLINVASQTTGDDLKNGINENLLFFTALKFIFVIGYYIFILVLAIKMRKRKLISIMDMILIAILIPLSFVYYLSTLRKHFNDLPLNNNSNLTNYI